MDGCPLGLGLVVEDKPTEFSCHLYSLNHGRGYISDHRQLFNWWQLMFIVFWAHCFLICEFNFFHYGLSILFGETLS